MGYWHVTYVKLIRKKVTIGEHLQKLCESSIKKIKFWFVSITESTEQFSWKQFSPKLAKIDKYIPKTTLDGLPRLLSVSLSLSSIDRARGGGSLFTSCGLLRHDFPYDNRRSRIYFTNRGSIFSACCLFLWHFLSRVGRFVNYYTRGGTGSRRLPVISIRPT